MITSGIGFFAAILVIAAFFKLLETSPPNIFLKRFFSYVPAVLMLYLTCMLFTTFNVWDIKQPEIKYMRSLGGLRGILLPAMIFLMLLKADLRVIIKLGPKMIIAFFAASTTIAIGFFVMFILMKSSFGDTSDPNSMAEVIGTFSALAGSWMGGGANMAAVQGALNIPDHAMTNVLVIDNINYSIWVMILIAMVSLAPRFNKFTNSSTDRIKEVSEFINKKEESEQKNITFTSTLILLASAFTVAAISINIAPEISKALKPLLPDMLKDFASRTTWLVLIATILGVIAAMTPLGKVAGSLEFGNVSLYLVIGLIASGASLKDLGDAPVYVLAGFIILFVHAILMIILAKLFKWDLFTCSIASLSNIGAVASAPVLAAAYSKSLVSVGVLMGLLGYIIGTVGGLLVHTVLKLLI